MGRPTRAIHDWTDDMMRDLLELYASEMQPREVAAALNNVYGTNFTPAAVQKKRERIERGQDSKFDPAIPGVPDLVRYLKRGRTIQDVSKHLKVAANAAAKQVAELEHPGYKKWSAFNEWGEAVFIMLPEHAPKAQPKERVFDYHMQTDGQPWLWIKFPDDFDVPVIKIFPLADLHVGMAAHARESMLGYFDYIESHENAFAIGTGDWFENALKTSVGAGVYEQLRAPRMQIHDLRDDLAPIAHKIFGAQPGNHEARTRNAAGICPLEYLCSDLGIPYINDQMHISVFWREHRWEIFSIHGKTSSRTKGGKLNEAMRPRQFQEFIHFILMSHVHDQLTNSVNCIVRNFQKFALELKIQHVVVCPSFMDYFNTYASRQGMEPGAKGAVALGLYPDGDYKVDPWGEG